MLGRPVVGGPYNAIRIVKPDPLGIFEFQPHDADREIVFLKIDGQLVAMVVYDAPHALPSATK
jgi:hypothetical protein